MNTFSPIDNDAPVISKVEIKRPKIKTPSIKNVFCADNIESELLETEGIIKSFTEIGSTDFNKNSFTIALIQIQSGELISARVCEEDSTKLVIGAKAIVYSKKTSSVDREGLVHYGYKAQLIH